MRVQPPCGMSSVRDQYEAYPYPARDPGDEVKRLITGSPSNPVEMDHFIWAGQRDWSRPLRALVAGGGTGDGLIQLAQLLTDAGRQYQITYIELSVAAKKVAEARARKRGLNGITFLTGDLLDAPEHGLFDYIDCCGVLHHLPEPAAGFAALRAALAPGGGLGFMVYAPHGRSGVYPLQEAFGALFADLNPQDRLQAAREVFARVPAGHPFKTNPHIGDHGQSDAGFYDLLLHSTDRAFDVTTLVSVMDLTGWDVPQFCMPALYDLSRLAPVPPDLNPVARMAIAEKLRGTMKVHVGYARPKGAKCQPDPNDLTLVPHLMNVAASQLAQTVARGKPLPLNIGRTQVVLKIAAAAAPLIAAIDGRRSLADIADHTKTDPRRLAGLWSPMAQALTGWGVLLYSRLNR